MAPFARPPVPPAVDIIPAMAIAADLRQAGVFSDWLLVTGLAFQALMCAVQPECGLCPVVEAPQGPSVRVVAGFTFGAEAALVDVVARMTRGATARCAFEDLG